MGPLGDSVPHRVVYSLSVRLGGETRLSLENWEPDRLNPVERVLEGPFACPSGYRMRTSRPVAVSPASLVARRKYTPEGVRRPRGSVLGRRRRSIPRDAEHLFAATVRSGPPEVRREVQTAAAHFPSAKTRVLFDPTTAELLDRIPHARTVHLSAHGSFRDDNPAFSRITTGDGALFLADIQEKRLRAELVVLSACDTGLTFTGRGDDVTGVALGFLGAGARSLVASQWRAHDKASRRIMEAFYEEYASRGSRDVPAALAAAGRAVREDWNHPLYWAAFAAYGR